MTRAQKKKLNDKVLAYLKSMPPTSHWPDRSQPFRRELSLLLDHIKRVAHCDVDKAECLRNVATRRKAIIFDGETKLWRGNPKWMP